MTTDELHRALSNAANAATTTTFATATTLGGIMSAAGLPPLPVPHPAPIIPAPTASAPVTEPPSPIPPVHIKIVRDSDTGLVSITGVDPLPPLKTVLEYLPKKYHRNCKFHSQTKSAVFNTWEIIPAQAWADAIGQAVLHQRANEQGASYEAKSLDEAFVAMGDRLYKLSPVALVKTNSALAAVRKVARMKMDRELLASRQQAKISADALIAEGLRLKAEGRKVLDAARAEAAKRPIAPPQWCLDHGLPIKYSILESSYYWYVGMTISFQIKHFDVKFYSARASANLSYTWPANIITPRKIRLWVPMAADGSYRKEYIQVDVADPQIPHISHTQACFTLGESIPTIKNFDEYLRLQSAISRCMHGVQLDSLRVAVSDWLPTFKDAVPHQLYQAINDAGNSWGGAEALARQLDAAAPVATPNPREIWTTT